MQMNWSAIRKAGKTVLNLQNFSVIQLVQSLQKNRRSSFSLISLDPTSHILLKVPIEPYFQSQQAMPKGL